MGGAGPRERLGAWPTVSPTRPRPNLRQHQGNPVDWWQWGPEACAEAKRRDVPLLISVGYAACH
jgi:uncharacterized protein YyaL (SSP411 family)